MKRQEGQGRLYTKDERSGQILHDNTSLPGRAGEKGAQAEGEGGARSSSLFLRRETRSILRTAGGFLQICTQGQHRETWSGPSGMRRERPHTRKHKEPERFQ